MTLTSVEMTVKEWSEVVYCSVVKTPGHLNITKYKNCLPEWTPLWHHSITMEWWTWQLRYNVVSLVAVAVEVASREHYTDRC